MGEAHKLTAWDADLLRVLSGNVTEDDVSDFVARDAEEALADAWASIDGKLEKFRAGRGLDIEAQPGGHYCGYLEDAHAMIERLERRGYVIVPNPDGAGK